ncbi:MAG: regulatory protein RecX [Phycisphaerales bacterium]|nr:regulatory protein RecX [Phycisphaerales bacterium]
MEDWAPFIGDSITSLTPTGRDPQWIAVRAGRRRLTTLRARDVADLQLHVGETLSQTRLAEIFHRARFAAGLDRALKHLKRRARSEAEMRAHLGERGLAGEHVEAILNRLRELGLIDDRAFAREAIEQTHRRGPAGERLMRHVLDRHGVEPETARQAIEEAGREAPSPVEQARLLVQARLPSMRDLPSHKQAVRLLGLLARRGFDDEVAQGVVREFIELPD